MSKETSTPYESEYSLASAVARFVDLSDVRLGEASIKLIGSRSELIRSAPWELRLKRNMSAAFDEASKMISVVADLAVEAGGSSQDNALVCSCVYYLDYRFDVNGAPQGEELDRHIKAFANINGTFNVWPYFRELVQSLAARVGLPPIVLPVYRVPRPAQNAATATTASEVTKPALVAGASRASPKRKAATAKGAARKTVARRRS